MNESSESQHPGRQQPPNSLSRAERTSQAADEKLAPQQASGEPTADGRNATVPAAHVVLYQPEIPQNTGNIGRTCVAVGAKLWIVRPASFQLDSGKLKRAGLDYWQHLQLGEARNWDHLLEQLPEKRFFFFSRFATRTIWDVEFDSEDVLVFGRETSGLPETILDPADPRAIRLPTSGQVRSLNLATTVGIALYEHQRQRTMGVPGSAVSKASGQANASPIQR